MSYRLQGKVSLDLVMQYHNEDIVQRISSDNNISYDEALQIFGETKRFLYLCGCYSGGFAPTTLIDLGWHAFILHTWDYQEFCMKYFGKFIHHFPNNRDTDFGSALRTINNTKVVARSVFGELSSYWNYEAKSMTVLQGTNECSDFPCKECSGTSTCQSN
jgi:hypothetical protein